MDKDQQSCEHSKRDQEACRCFCTYFSLYHSDLHIEFQLDSGRFKFTSSAREISYQGKACHQSGSSYRLLELGFAKVEDMKFILLICDMIAVSSSRRRVRR